MLLPSSLPVADVLKPLMRSLAVLDAICCPEWDYRYFSFDPRWGENEEMGSIRNGSGDDVFILFNSQGCFLKGFSHEYPSGFSSSREAYESVPPAFTEATIEPAFTPDNVSFVSWHLNGAQGWASALPIEKTDTNIFFLLDCLNGAAKTYQNFARDYFEMELKRENIVSIFQSKPLSETLATSINADIDYQALVEECKTIGYPIASIFTPQPHKRPSMLRKLFRK